jgi:hypothetical protein
MTCNSYDYVVTKGESTALSDCRVSTTSLFHPPTNIMLIHYMTYFAYTICIIMEPNTITM